jgi:hypothetical protein
MKVLLSLRPPDLVEGVFGLASVVRTLGVADGLRAIAFATRRHLAALASGEGQYPEAGKRRIWFKLHYLGGVYEYLKRNHRGEAAEYFDAIVEDPTTRFIGNVSPPARCLSRDYVLHHLWRDMISRDYNIEAESLPSQDNSASLQVHRCFINEVVRDIGLMPVADRFCFGDFRFWEDYHPNVHFSRTRTLLAGDLLCDHTLTWVDAPPQDRPARSAAD